MAEYVLDALYNALYNWMHISCWMLEREALQSHILQFKMSASVKKKVQAYVQLYKIQIKLRWALFVTYTIIQSIMRSEMCSLHLTHPSGAVGSQHCSARGAVGGCLALLKGLTSVVDTSCQSRDSNPQHLKILVIRLQLLFYGLYDYILFTQ